MVQIQADYGPKGAQLLVINTNDAQAFPDRAPWEKDSGNESRRRSVQRWPRYRLMTRRKKWALYF